MSIWEISIPRESIVKVASDGILGNKYLSISPDGDLSNTWKSVKRLKKLKIMNQLRTKSVK